MKSTNLLRRFIREEIGGNYHTVRNDSYTFQDFQDYDIEISGEGSGRFHLNVFYKGNKLFDTQSFSSESEARHAARMIIDSDRVKRMNHAQEEKRQ